MKSQRSVPQAAVEIAAGEHRAQPRSPQGLKHLFANILSNPILKKEKERVFHLLEGIKKVGVGNPLCRPIDES